MFGLPGGSEWILILLVIVLLFGAKKIPELMKGLGSGVKEFKKAATHPDKESENSSTEEKKAEVK